MSRRFLPGLLTRLEAPRLPAGETKQYATSAPTRVDQLLTGMSHSARRAWPVDRAVAEGFERSVWTYKAIDTIADHQATLDFQLRQSDELINDHPLVRLLNDGKANPLETGRDFRYRLSTQILLSPRGAFVEITSSRAGTPLRLDLLPPGRTRPVPGRGGDLLSHFETITADGTRVAIDPERVRWFRKPHPIDPYRGMTPLEAAGLSVDLDFLARLYNVSFLRNDGRPGGIVAIEGRTNEADARLLESRFGRGPAEAGKVTVISGKLSYVDLASRPRDMAYGEMAARAKEETLAAFGVGESVLGNSSGRTWDNAEQELYAFWTVTMPPHMRIIAAGFDNDSDDGITGEFDVSKVEVLRRTAAARRTEAREELDKGVISLDEYRQIAEYEPYDLPHTRALYVAQGKTPIPTREEDAVALGLAAPAEEAPAQETGAEEISEEESGEEAPAEEAGPPIDMDDPATAEAFTMLQDIVTGNGTSIEEIKALTAPPVPAPPAAPDPDTRDHAEQALLSILAPLARRLIERTAARVASPKARKGTRHFHAEYAVDTRVGSQPLDVGRVTNASHWQHDTADAVGMAVSIAVSAAARNLLGPFADAPATLETVTEEITHWLAHSAAEQVTELGTVVAAADAAGDDMTDIVTAVRAQLPHVEQWARSATAQAATALTAAAQAATALHLAGPGGRVSAIWQAGPDAVAHPSHANADGQARDSGELFTVGTAALRWPGDPNGPQQETTGCRCSLLWLISPA
ncbi:phage portal protein [Planomonospora sp. ID82291]|uniref:phage portal protein n=1 Tax=Planomonospora sp. ID82291 TaxID=2738136 RepID=UPI0018C362F3|nr:phage portal protein [Planomonospora sp. ID82291]MBG0818777.1 phage portal protein [Planomonospora sp. ID82291]